MDSKRCFLSPAKINLVLRVLRKREDGYHEIMSLVDIVSLYDVIRIKETDDENVVVKRISGHMPETTTNTIYKAIDLVRKFTGIKRGIFVEVEKRIPLGSGLGGASSNAATVIKALSSLWDLKLSEKDLLRIGTLIGADVPLFIYGKPCIVKGIGDRIEPASLPKIWYVIVYPKVELSTKEVYGRLKIVLTKGENDIKLRSDIKSLDEVASILRNDLEEVASILCPTIKVIKDMLKLQGAKGVSMTGSGSSVFGCFEDRESAERAAKNLLSFGNVFVARSTND
ncbi:MAG: 4-(cytidine 5'-diphospho)-2-C-methyl-D-erythritol kinase [Desulfobacterota bacterium]|nr:4-(cytidine 5'-diphospho)-2-C-methyl-D-erythritol kinase [Thermodesulfobacteriota bacterium]MDW8002122.1 4-(cytidine 5'-diphospho)-2-C-methyl-D-erythritol kinase [Deltaproteobacteria bacterium]